ncbi:MAG: arylesterase [Alphaproteobacteria bacterium]
MGASAGHAAPAVILAFGDSLTAGYGLALADSFPVRLEAALRQAGIETRVVNAGVSGDTTAGGLRRIDWALGENPALVILELGANDGLRGLDPDQTRANLDAILARIAAKGAKVLLTGMRAPRNLGPEYGDRFDAVFPDLAARHDVAFYPFFLEGVALDPKLNQADGIHPNPAGVEAIVRNILPHVRRALAGDGG